MQCTLPHNHDAAGMSQPQCTARVALPWEMLRILLQHHAAYTHTSN